APPSIELTKTASAGPHAVGSVITYSFVVKNNANVTLSNFPVTGPLPGLGTISPASVASLAPGASTTFTAPYTVTQADVNAGNIQIGRASCRERARGPEGTDTDEEDGQVTANTTIEVNNTGAEEAHDGERVRAHR